MTDSKPWDGPVHEGMHLTLTLNEWAAIANALGYTAENYCPTHSDVVLHELRERISAKLQAAHPGHRPT
jgi:hypothetical protein